MLVDFNFLPATSRFWIFTADRLLTSDESKLISEELASFIKQWTAHKQELNASFTLIDQAVLVIGVDEAQTGASGCSIDAMTKEVVKVAQMVSVDFLNRFAIVLKTNKGLLVTNANRLKELYTSGEVTEQTLVSNTLLNNFSELNSHLYIPIKETWMNRYLVG